MDFTLTNWLGCDSIVTVSVAAFQTSVMTIGGFICEGEFYDYNGNQVPAGTSQTFYETNQWGCQDTIIVDVAALPTSASSLQLVACPGELATYNGTPVPTGTSMDFTLTNWLFCDSIVTVTVVAAQSDTTQLALQVCEGETVDYNGQTLSANETFEWVGTNQAGCDSVVQVSVTALPSVSYDLSAAQICWNALNGSIAVGNIQGNTGPYQFSLNGSVFQTDTLFAGLPPGNYTVALRDQNGCVFAEQTSIGAIPPIEVTVQDETLVCGETVVLSPTVSSQLPLAWEWRDSTGVIATAPQISVSTPGLYSFTATNDCEAASGQVGVTAVELSVNRLIYLPNSFSPNGDGINDCYQGFVKPDLDVLSYELMIFDRWGEKLFETTDINDCWDGLLRGKEMNPAVMVYWMTLDARNCDGRVERIFRKGEIHLVK
ncbi:MAG: gliding motility-associated C-terminal domain-containing protein [Saprospiraceae bacterium]|nr:gliding motility-associated C-terminal domain-containing protein [Saprospiraceae bacterium]